MLVEFKKRQNWFPVRKKVEIIHRICLNFSIFEQENLQRGKMVRKYGDGSKKTYNETSKTGR